MRVYRICDEAAMACTEDCYVPVRAYVRVADVVAELRRMAAKVNAVAEAGHHLGSSAALALAADIFEGMAK